MTIAVIVQARWGSTRLPGKALAQLGAGSVLKRVLERCARIPGIDRLVCAIPEGAESDLVAEEAERCDAIVVRGSEKDVLSRYAKAASEVGADVVIRITSDCPFIDPIVCGRVLALLSQAHVDYSCNDLPASWPHGLDCEIFHASLLHWADALADHPADREHVTPWIRSNPDLKKASLTGPGGDFTHMRWTLDWPEDLAFAQAVFTHMGERAASASAAEIAAFCMRRPDVAALNAARSDTVRLLANLRADFETAPTDLVAVA